MARRHRKAGRDRAANLQLLPAAPGERLHKVLARVGQGSRREIESRIGAGEVLVNSLPAGVGQQVSPGDQVRFADQVWRVTARNHAEADRARVLLYHKPVGELCTRRDPEGRPCVFDRLPILAGGRWISVGRLDINTSGLLLFTDDGQLANRLMHPRAGVTREYLVRVRGPVDTVAIARLLAGVVIDGRETAFDTLVPRGGAGVNRWFTVTVHEGRHRIVRRLWESQGCQVNRLIRTRFGPVRLPRELAAGAYRALPAAEREPLLEAVAQA